MNPDPVNANQLFRTERRRSTLPFLIAGALLIAGYIGAGAALIDNYSHQYASQTAPVGGPRA